MPSQTALVGRPSQHAFVAEREELVIGSQRVEHRIDARQALGRREAFGQVMVAESEFARGDQRPWHGLARLARFEPPAHFAAVLVGLSAQQQPIGGVYEHCSFAAADRPLWRLRSRDPGRPRTARAADRDQDLVGRIESKYLFAVAMV